MALPSCRIHAIRILRIVNHFSNSCPLVITQCFFPAFTTIDTFIKTTLATFVPKRSLSCDINYIAVFRMYNDSRDMLGFFKSHIGPCFTTIVTAVHAIAKTNMSTTAIFASTNPNCFGVIRVYRNTSNRVGAFMVK